ncbi:sterol desaturase family protein [Rhizobium lusitanum]|uniref:Sterol desaturase family protein n=1 Tax=Rhizobium lusitanum TaxID=293958 RepID=A0A6L9UAH4_9HYPH|nr:sterol desaturase family protein [Rhizobium lusitanum]NEI72933.1 sterol desaturase family protein [Rhizobium lusitanum]
MKRPSVYMLKGFAYYMDFVVYPLVVAGLSAAYLMKDFDGRPLRWLATVIVGAAVWTLVEYIIHRFILHHVMFIREMHDQHHRSPKELIDTPIWLSLSFMFAGVLLPSWWLFGFGPATGFTVGMTLGYLIYGLMHHAMHHWRIRHGTYLYRAKRRHAQHHASIDEGNYGVSSPVWDYVFGTELPDHGMESGKRRPWL